MRLLVTTKMETVTLAGNIIIIVQEIKTVSMECVTDEYNNDLQEKKHVSCFLLVVTPT